MARTDENYRVKTSLFWPQLKKIQAFETLFNYLDRFKNLISERDEEISNKINQLHIEYVTTAPADASPPDYPVPVLQIYDDGADHWLYVYSEDGWHKVQLTKI
jgi:hypothetical protein